MPTKKEVIKTYIQETNLQFKGALIKRAATTRIVVHHSASSPFLTAADIHRVHLNKGWSGIGYHYVIRANGLIERGRPEWAKGAHCYQDNQHEANTNGIGICVVGNFMTSVPTTQQMESLVWLIKNIQSRYGNIPVLRHRDIMATACPGTLFPWNDLQTMLKGGKIMSQTPDWEKAIMDRAIKGGLIETGKHNADDLAPKWFVLKVTLDVLDKIKEVK